MTVSLHTRSLCDECRIADAIVERRGVWFCGFCDSSNEIPSGPQADGYASVAAPPAHLPTVCAADATLSSPTHFTHSPGPSANCGEAPVSPLLSFEAEVAALEASGLLCGPVSIFKYARAFRVAEAISSFPISVSARA